MTATETRKAIFHNNGIIQPEAWEMHGVSAKTTDHPIGMFGTGLCYAIAVIIRHGHKITIKAGDQLHEFGVKDINFRGKEFQQITCNGKGLSFTTSYGETWPLWAAYRELASNCIDEGGIQYIGEPQDEGTSIIVEGDEFIDICENHDDFFIGDREPIATCSLLDVYEGKGILYYRGVKVGELENASYSYLIKDKIELTEDRTFKYEYQIRQKIGWAYASYITDKTLLKRIATKQTGWESEFADFEWTWSPEFKEIVLDVWATAPATLNERIQKLVKTKAREAVFKTRPIDEDQVPMLDAAKAFLAKAGYPVSEQVCMVDSDDPMTIAYVHDEKIHLTTRAFEKGLFYLVTVLFEEQAHVNGFQDASRHFQTYLINELVTHARKRFGVAL
jgi:hypothetical protein